MKHKHQRKHPIALALVGSILVSGCATPPNEISAQSVSPYQYQDYNCSTIAAELRRVGNRGGELHAQLKKTAEDDSAQMAIGMLVFWPALLFLEGGDGTEAQEYAKLKGEYQALEQVAIHKQCGASIIPTESPFKNE